MQREPYYVDEGRSHDFLLRCKDCQALVTFEVITKLGCCPCGNKRFNEIKTLSEQEEADIRNGIIVFQDSDKFLAEFSSVGHAGV